MNVLSFNFSLLFLFKKKSTFLHLDPMRSKSWIRHCYRRIQVIANYRKKRFAMVTLPSAPFYQGHKNTTILNHVLVEGQQLVVFGERDLSQFNSEAAAGLYSIDLKLALRVRARYGMFKSRNYKPYYKIDCWLKVPFSSNETSPSAFEATQCWNVYLFSNPDD